MSKQENKETPNTSSEVRPISLTMPPEDSGPEMGAPQSLATEGVSVLLFEIGGEGFAIGVEQTDGVVDCPRITPLPDAPDGVIGVASVRGRMTMVMDFSLHASPGESKQRLILLKGESQLGLLAERVEGVVALPPEKTVARKAGQRPGDRQSGNCRWAVITYFKNAGHDVPVIDVAALAEI